jgi:hypothetical protein
MHSFVAFRGVAEDEYKLPLYAEVLLLVKNQRI